MASPSASAAWSACWWAGVCSTARTVVASDYSADRRSLAQRWCADIVVDPAVDAPWDAAAGHSFMTTMPDEYNADIDAIQGMARLPVLWWQVWRVLDKVGATAPKRPVVFECVGVPGRIDGILAVAPLHFRVVVVGVCMGVGTLLPTARWTPRRS